MKKETIKNILNETEKGYDLISKKFSQTRKSFWGELEFIGNYAKNGDKVLDYGCGNGRLFELFSVKKIDYTGADVSGKLIEFAKQRYQTEQERKFLKLDPGQGILPFSDNYFNTVYSIAVFHHIPDKSFRLGIAKELNRILLPGGYVVITVWNLWQKKYRKNVFENWKNKFLGKSDLDWNDCYVSFTDNEGKKFNRFHHAFTVRDLKKLFSDAGFEIEKCEVVEDRNIVLIGKKI